MTSLVALALPGGPHFVDALRRVWVEGDVALPLDLRLPQTIQQEIVASMGVDRVVTASGSVEALSRSGAHTAREAGIEAGDALVMMTSGSTGKPKGVVLTHEAVEASARITSRALGVSGDDHWLACLPLSHVGGMSVITRALHMKTKLTVLPGFDPELVTNAAHAGATLVSLVPTAMRRVDPDIFRTVLLGGGPPPEALPPNAVTTYGMTETGSGVVYDGRPLDGVELRVSDGELWVRSATLLRCYTNGNDPKTHDGWFATGDAATLGDDGTLHVHGRIAEVINSGGELIWPTAVEAALRQHRLVSDARVFGVDDAEWGERVVADIELVDASQAPAQEELRELVKDGVASYAAPKEIRFVTSLARTSNGKVMRGNVSPG